jgi:hypothetical protein
MRKLKYVKLFENFLTKIDIKKGDKVTIKKERLLDGSKSDLSVGVKYTGFLKDDIERNKPIILIDDKGNKIMNTSPITKFEYQKSLVMTNTSIYSIKKEENSDNQKIISNKPNKPNNLKIMSSKHGLDIYLEPIEVVYKDDKKIRYWYKVGFLSTSNRDVVLVNINGIKVPFYKSSGSVEKEGVNPGDWYNIWGITTSKEDGEIYTDWLNKGNSGYGGNIAKYYNIELFRIIANKLKTIDFDKIENKIGDLYTFSENGIKQINKDMKPSTLGTHRLDYDFIESFKKKLISVLPDEHKKLVKMGSDF